MGRATVGDGMVRTLAARGFGTDKQRRRMSWTAN